MSDLLIRGARRVGTAGEPCDVLVRAGRMMSIRPAGTTDAPPGLATLDAAGAWLAPGLWDHHTHFDQWAAVRRRVDVSAARSAADAAAIIAGQAASHEGDLVVAVGYRDGLWPDKPHRVMLDGALPGREVAVVSSDLHSMWCSTPGLSATGHSAATHPDGILHEQAAFDALARINRVPEAVLDGWAAAAVRDAAARGVVGVIDLEMEQGLERWRSRFATGTDQLRIASGVYFSDLDRMIGAGLRTGDVIPDTRGRLTVGPFKLITDGALGARTAWTSEPYAGTDTCGQAAMPRSEALEWLRKAADAGYSAAVHAIGDEANRVALDLFAETGMRGSIEHAQLLHERDIPRFARLGIAASIQPVHTVDDRDLVEKYWPDSAGRAYPFRALRDAGTTLRLGSDAPVAPLDPWRTMQAAIARTLDVREPWHPEQALDALTAWRGSTDGRATAQVGDVADCILIDRDPLTCPPNELGTTRVLATFVDGEATHFDGLEVVSTA